MNISVRKDGLPPEWARQTAVLLTWPRPDGDFGPLFAAVEQNFIAIAHAVTRFEALIVNTASHADALRKRLLDAGLPEARLRVFEVPNNDVWARDHGPLTVLHDGSPVHLDFQFNGWGGKYSAEHDNHITRRLADLGAWQAPVKTIDFILEGGAIEVDGAGSLMTTESCLLAPTRNPGWQRADIEGALRKHFSISRIHWLQHGSLLGDDTDGHIDTLARFCDPRTIAYQACEDRKDPHYEPLAAMVAELECLRDVNEQPYHLIPLPLPTPILDADGRRLPAGYANFLIINDAVLVPVYDDPQDEQALARLRRVFTDREVIGIDCRALIHQYGSLHCISMQIPAAPSGG